MASSESENNTIYQIGAGFTVNQHIIIYISQAITKYQISHKVVMADVNVTKLKNENDTKITIKIASFNQKN